jgi:hypothetical protein
MKTKKENQPEEDDIVNLGFVQNLAQKVSLNELAAKGI